MAIIKCKMCGGDLNVAEGMTVVECEYCGTKQTVPNVDNEKKVTLFGRANRLRLACEFDKAAAVYESIVAEFSDEAEAYWGLVLCKYGIEYVDDPATGKKIPTCHRSSFDSVMEDSDFDQACENADVVARKVYREEAKTIEDIRKGIIEVSGKEQPYDIFICYKETNENGERTIDSVLAQDVYDALTEKGYRVFFSRITLEDKLGQEYEPYIFAALNSAKIMLAFGTDYEYFNAVWVKNEWSRFLKLMAADKSKHLIPCYKGIDAYDMPKEFAKLQAQDMSKVGAVQDLLRGIEKLLPKKIETVKETVKETVVMRQGGGPNTDTLLKRGNMALEDGNWEQADKFFEEVLNQNAECAEAYLGKAMAAWNWHTKDEYTQQFLVDANYTNNKDFHRARQFATGELLTYFQQIDEERAAYIKEQQEEREAYVKAQQEKAERDRKYRENNIPKLAKIRERLKPANGVIVNRGCRTFGLKSDGAVVAVGNNKKGQCDVGDWRNVVAICTSDSNTVGLKSDGTVVATGSNRDGQCDVGDWRNIVAISADDFHTVGLKSDGTVVATGINRAGQCDVGDWRNIVAISAYDFHTVGLKSDGTVVATGDNFYGQCDVGDWRDVVAICTSGSNTVGLKSDGTVVATGSNLYGQCDVRDWRDVVAICASGFHTVGLKSDGTVVAVGETEYGRCYVSYWNDIVAISVSGDHTVGLKADGTVVATKDYGNGVSDWSDIVAICAAYNCTIGVKADGAVVATGNNKYGECNVSDWKLFNSLDALAYERKEAAARAQQERIEAEKRAQQERQQLQAEKSALNAELANLKGFFTGKRRREIEARLAEIEKELKEI